MLSEPVGTLENCESDQNQGSDYANFTTKLNFTWCRRWQRTLGEGICFSTGRSLGRLESCHLAEIWMIMFVWESKEYFWPFMGVVYGNLPALSPSDCLQRAKEVLKVAPETSSTRYVQSPSCCSHLFITFTSCPQNVALSWSGNARNCKLLFFRN